MGVFGNWLRRRSIVESSTRDLERFLVSLRGMDSEELGALVAAATVSVLQFRMSEIAQKFQRQEEYASASGAKVWLFTFARMHDSRSTFAGSEYLERAGSRVPPRPDSPR